MAPLPGIVRTDPDHGRRPQLPPVVVVHARVALAGTAIAARARRVAAHRTGMISICIGALRFIGLSTLLPGRPIGHAPWSWPRRARADRAPPQGIARPARIDNGEPTCQPDPNCFAHPMTASRA